MHRVHEDQHRGHAGAAACHGQARGEEDRGGWMALDLDKDSNGYVTLQELESYLLAHNETTDREGIKQFFAALTFEAEDPRAYAKSGDEVGWEAFEYLV